MISNCGGKQRTRSPLNEARRRLCFAIICAFAFTCSKCFAQSEGWVDPSFEAQLTGLVNFPGVDLILVDKTPAILVGGWISPRLVRLNLDGSRDLSFRPSLKSVDRISDIITREDGSYLVAINGHLQLLDRSGNSITNFLPELGVNESVSHLLLQPDGKILLGGNFRSTNAIDNITRLNADGTRDITFRLREEPPESLSFSPNFQTFARQPNGKIVIASYWERSIGSGPLRNGVLFRRREQGPIDDTFRAVLNEGGEVLGIAALPDGKILIGGRFTNVNGQVARHLCRLNSDGSIDRDFIFSDNGWAVTLLILQEDGRIVIGRNRAVERLNPDGSWDANFGVISPNGEVNALAIQPDGRILVGGTFTKIASLAAPNFESISLDQDAAARISVLISVTTFSRNLLARLIVRPALCVLEASGDLLSWGSVTNFPASFGTWEFHDSMSRLSPRLFYRVSYAP